MKILIRSKIFETNSSATHSMVILSNDEYEEWKKNELYVREGYFDKLYTYDEAIEDANKYGAYDDDLRLGDVEAINNGLNSDGYFKHDDWFNDEFLEADSCGYRTEHGDEIVICYRYGYDG